MSRCQLFIGLLLVMPTNVLAQPSQGSQPSCSSNNNQRAIQAYLNNFINNIVQAFGNQAEDDRHQFAVLIMVPANLDDVLNMDYLPSTSDGNPIVDNTVSLSPARIQDRVNYVVSRPHIDDVHGDIIHAEVIALPEMDMLLHNFRCHYGTDPAMIILYSWIIPCDNCFRQIIYHFGNLDHNIRRALMYSTDGMRTLTESERQARQQDNEYFINFLRGIDVDVVNVRCYLHPHNQGRLIKRHAGQEACPAVNTVQMCLYRGLLRHYSLSTCGSPPSEQWRVAAEVVNRMMKACAGEKFKAGCGLRYLQKPGVVSGACQIIINDRLSFIHAMSMALDDCMTETGIVISKPMNTNAPEIFPGYLRTVAELSLLHTANNIPCTDNRREGLFCSNWKAEYISAGNGVCRTACEMHSDYYRWCNLQIGSWHYCCDENAPCTGGWCRSGHKSVWCFPDLSWTTNSGRMCRSYTPCGFHYGVRYRKWCWVDDNGTVEDC